MVKLSFNKNSHGPISKSSVRTIANLNPFQNIEESFSNLCIKDYLPTKDVIGLENCLYVFNEWYHSSKTNPFLLIGPTGCGKTTLVESYCLENKINLYTVKYSEFVKSKKDLLKEIQSFMEYSTQSFFIKQKNVENKLILIDEFQNGNTDLLSTTDILELSFPKIIIISGDSKGSKLSDLKKSTTVYYISEIPMYQMKKLTSLPDSIIKKCKSDKRLLLNMESFLKNGNSPETFIENFYKDTDINSFEFINELFDSVDPIELNKIYKIYDTDGYLLSNLVQENYIDFNDSIEAVARSAEAISYGETIFSDTYESNRSFLPDNHCLNSLCIPSYYSRTPVKKNKCQLRTNTNNNRFNIYLNNKKILCKINGLAIYDIKIIKKIFTKDLIKKKTLSKYQEEFFKNLIGTTGGIDKMELIYKHFSEFNDLETKAKNFPVKFKEKISKLF